MKAKLLDENTINELVAVQSIEEVVEILEENTYKDDLVELSTKYSGVELVNRAVELNFVKTMKKLSTFLPSKYNALLNLILEEWTLNSLKLIIASKATGTPITQSNYSAITNEQEHIFELGKDADLDLRKTVKRLANFGTGYAKVFETINRNYLAKGQAQLEDFRIIYKELDDYYYNKLGRAAESEKDPAVKALLLAKVDFVNSMTVARLMLAGVDKKEIQENLITASGRNRRAMHKLLEKANTLEIVEEIVNTHKLDSSITGGFKETNSLVKLEVELERKLMQKALRTSKVASLSFAVMLAYIYLKQQEVAFLKAIAYSTQAGISEEMKQLVFAVK